MLRSNLRNVLDAKGITVEKLAVAIDYDIRDVQIMYDDKLDDYPRDLLGKICSYFDITVEKLIVIE